jgi:hypothetical protein
MFLLPLVMPLVLGQDAPTNHGLIGYGITMYKPACASACQAVTPLMLDCDHTMMKRMDMGMESPAMDCIATNLPYLQTVAYCIYTHCQGVPLDTMEEWWEKSVVGSMANQPSPMYTYAETLSTIKTAPNISQGDGMLMKAVVVDEDTYVANWKIMDTFEWIEGNHSRYG